MDQQLKTQLDRIEDTVTKLWERVSNLERKSSMWGAVGGFLAVFATKLGGCV